MRRLVPLVIGVLGLVTAGLVVSSPAQAATTTFEAGLLGTNQDPPNASTATGFATITVNDTTNEVCVAAETSGLSGPVTADHIHQGAAGTNGPVVIDFAGSLNTCVTSTGFFTRTARIGSSLYTAWLCAEPAAGLSGSPGRLPIRRSRPSPGSA